MLGNIPVNKERSNEFVSFNCRYDSRTKVLPILCVCGRNVCTGTLSLYPSSSACSFIGCSADQLLGDEYIDDKVLGTKQLTSIASSNRSRLSVLVSLRQS